MSTQELYYDIHVFVCTNRRPEEHERGSCAARGSEALWALLREKAKALGLGKTRINKAGCLDRCERGPVVVVYPQGHWYRVQSEADVDELLAALAKGETAARLLLENNDR